MPPFNPVKKLKAPATTKNFEPVAKAQSPAPLEPGVRSVSEPQTSMPIFERIARPTVEGLGLGLGGLAGSVVPGWGTVVGAGAGYMGAKGVNRLLFDDIDYDMPIKEQAKELPQATLQSAKDFAEGATIEMGGQSAGKLLQLGAKGLGRLGLQAVGKLTGTGAGAAEQAVKSGQKHVGKNIFKSQTAFDRALRGDLSGQEVVDMAHSALSQVKDIRAAQYLKRLRNIETMGTQLPALPGQGNRAMKHINPRPIVDKLTNLAKQYRISVKVNPRGEYFIDTSQAALGKTGRNDLKEMIKEVGEWKDFTPTGLDALKRRIGDFYSESSQARQFAQSLKKTIHKTITDEVPEYAVMTKEYEKATRLIKDIESNLMMRKQGMSGRIVSDQTLRRLTSAMKDNFELRNELVQALSAQGGEDVMGAVAGHAMSPFMPRGITGTGAAIIGSLYASAVNPKLWPVVMSSSPRVAAEFLRVYGKYATELGLAQPAGKTAAYGLLTKPGN